jgi:hypothetical protein
MGAPAATPGHAGLVYGCLTHVPLWLEFPAYVTPIHLGQAQGDGRLNLRDLAPEWERHHPILGGLVGTFALKKLVQRAHPGAKRVGVCQYRKFISRRRISAVPESTYPVMDMVYKGRLGPQALAEAMDPGPQPFLFSRPLFFPKGFGLLAQYAHAHHPEDLLRFTAEAVAQGAIDKTEVTSFFAQPLMFPGGVELGVYPAEFWLRSVTAIESVVRACVDRYPGSHADDYQARAWAFCAERLGSHLLLRQLLQQDTRSRWTRRWARTLPRLWHSHAGQMNVVTEQDGAGYALGRMKASGG